MDDPCDLRRVLLFPGHSPAPETDKGDGGGQEAEAGAGGSERRIEVKDEGDLLPSERADQEADDRENI